MKHNFKHRFLKVIPAQILKLRLGAKIVNVMPTSTPSLLQNLHLFIQMYMLRLGYSLEFAQNLGKAFKKLKEKRYNGTL